MTVSIGLGRVGSKFFHLLWVGLGWVSKLMDWVGSGQTKWTHGQLWVTVLGKLFTPIVPLFTKQQNW